MTESTTVDPIVSESGKEPSNTKENRATTEESTTATVLEDSPENNDSSVAQEAPSSIAAPIVSASKKSRPPYKYDPNKITLRFLFANRDGLTVTVECNPADTVGEVKGALLSVWPQGKVVVDFLCEG